MRVDLAWPDHANCATHGGALSLDTRSIRNKRNKRNVPRALSSETLSEAQRHSAYPRADFAARTSDLVSNPESAGQSGRKVLVTRAAAQGAPHASGAMPQ